MKHNKISSIVLVFVVFAVMFVSWNILQSVSYTSVKAYPPPILPTQPSPPQYLDWFYFEPTPPGGAWVGKCTQCLDDNYALLYLHVTWFGDNTGINYSYGTYTGLSPEGYPLYRISIMSNPVDQFYNNCYQWSYPYGAIVDNTFIQVIHAMDFVGANPARICVFSLPIIIK